MTDIAINVVGQDRRGIIADVSEVLAGLRLNLTDSTMTLLRGHFAMTLICTGPAEVGPTTVCQALAPLAADGTLTASARTIAAEPAMPPGGVPYTMTVYGADRLGIVAALTRELAVLGGNVTDLTTRLSGGLYLLAAEVELPAEADVEEALHRLDQVAKRLGVELNLRPSDADVL